MYCFHPGISGILPHERFRTLIARIAIAAVSAALLVSSSASAECKPQTAAAFDLYVANREARIEREQSSSESFLAFQSLPPARRIEVQDHLRRGEVLVHKSGGTPTAVPGGLIHHWLGTAFIPSATVRQLLTVLQDYDHLGRYYYPEVVRSRLRSHSGDDFLISMRLRKHQVVTVVLDTEYEVHYGQLDANHQYSLSRSTRVTEIADAGERNEHALAEGHDHGFMWRLNTYWRFQQAREGVFVQCEAISLTRDVPAGLGWLIGPFTQNIPRESLQFTLRATRNAVLELTKNSSVSTLDTRNNAVKQASASGMSGRTEEE